jgi:hypothetical protein
MATRKKAKVKKVRFELTRSGIGGIGVICFCIFLWMFLLGVWAGQSLLVPAPPKVATLKSVHEDGGEKLVNFDDQKKKRPVTP